jgi:hypothetical protein
MQLFFPRTRDVGVEQLLLVGWQATRESIHTSNKLTPLLSTFSQEELGKIKVSALMRSL